jgi:hypothetical protein
MDEARSNVTMKEAMQCLVSTRRDPSSWIESMVQKGVYVDVWTWHFDMRTESRTCVCINCTHSSYDYLNGNAWAAVQDVCVRGAATLPLKGPFLDLRRRDLNQEHLRRIPRRADRSGTPCRARVFLGASIVGAELTRPPLPPQLSTNRVSAAVPSPSPHSISKFNP